MKNEKETISEPEYEELMDCHDCDAKPGEFHKAGCDTEMCSVCGGQYFMCRCPGHDPAFARWTGIWPGSAEAKALGVDLGDFHKRGLHKLFFIKPRQRRQRRIS